MGEIKTMLDEEIRTELANLSILEDGSEEKTKAIAHLEKLYKLRLEEIRAINEDDDKFVSRELKKSELISQNILQWSKIAAELVICGITLEFYRQTYDKSLKFEETGIFTSPTFKGFMSVIKPTNLFRK